MQTHHDLGRRSTVAEPTPSRWRSAGSPYRRAAAAVAVTALMVLGSLGGLASIRTAPVPSAHSSTASSTTSSVAPSSSAPEGTATPAPAGPGADCGAGGDAPAATTTTDATHPASVLYNSQVEPDAVLTGPYAYVARGAAIRDQGYGEIDLTWPGGSTANLVAAYMVWSILNNTTPPAWGTINGNNVTGTWTAFATPSPCWAPAYIYTFFAEVTPYVVNGENVLTSFPSGITSGADPWASAEKAPLDEGVSLIAVYDAGTTTTQEVTVYTGAETSEGGALDEQLNYSTTNSPSATTTFIVADGQLPGNEAFWNGTELSGDAFPGNDPKETTTAWSYGNLSDTVTFSVPVEVGSNNTSALTQPTDSDCFTWIGQVLSVGVPAAPPPYPVTFAEQGLADGTQWSLTVNGTEGTGTVADFASHLVFELGNGTFGYTITPIPGYTGTYAGSVTVDGGAVYVRVAFHVLVYLLNVTEVGLPAETTWWVDLKNTSQALNSNSTAYYQTYLNFNESNGTYNLTDGTTSLYLSDTPALNVTVAGATADVTITFRPPPLYTVTFVEHNLTAGTPWSGRVYTNFGDYSIASSTPSTSLQLPNTTYGLDSVYPASEPGYTIAPEVYFAVDGAPTTVNLDFALTYTVNVTETGLPGTVLWWVYLDGPGVYDTQSSYGTTIGFDVPNGSYTFSIPAIYAWQVNVSSGPATVAGANVTIDIAFSLAPTFEVEFTESGLPAGTAWSVTIYLPVGPSEGETSESPTIAVNLPNGTYAYTVGAVPNYVSTPTGSDVTVDGALVSVTIDFSATFTIAFDETGLPTGSEWYIYLNSSSNYSTGATINFSAENGSYDFDVYSSLGFSAAPQAGTVVVAGADQVVPVVFSSTYYPTFTVEFTESGLPTGSAWSVVMNDYELHSTSLALNFTEEDGTFYFDVYGPDGYTATPNDAPAVVDGAPITEAITFAPTVTDYLVEFEETGLPAETSWTVTLGGVPEEGSTTSISFSEPADSYAYSIVATGYYADPASGSVDVVDESVYVPVTFSAVPPATFTVTFEETGLPSGSVWWANITGGSSLRSTDASATTDLANGTYDYSFQSQDPTYRGGTGVLDVDGEIQTVMVEFTLVEFAVTFEETGLPTGTVWWVNITDGPSLESDGTSVSTSLPNGTAAYTPASSNHTLRAGAGTATVRGVPLTVSVVFGHSTSSSSPTFLGLTGDGGYFALGAVFALAAFFLLFLLARRRKRKEEPATPGAAPPPPTA